MWLASYLCHCNSQLRVDLHKQTLRGWWHDKDSTSLPRPCLSHYLLCVVVLAENQLATGQFSSDGNIQNARGCFRNKDQHIVACIAHHMERCSSKKQPFLRYGIPLRSWQICTRFLLESGRLSLYGFVGSRTTTLYRLHSGFITRRRDSCRVSSDHF